MNMDVEDNIFVNSEHCHDQIMDYLKASNVFCHKY